jgi:hypothetical protein
VGLERGGLIRWIIQTTAGAVSEWECNGR